MKPHKCIRLIRFALKRGSFSVKQACDACDMTDKEFWFIGATIFVFNANQGARSGGLNEVQEWVLSPTAYFGYLQFLSYWSAVGLGLAALIVAVLALLKTC
jgi:hypothetical protein